MPYPDYGALLPAEALFEEPKAYAGVLKAEALKRASYLSSMDQFYSELTESTRRFEKQYTLAEREVVFGEEEAVWQRGFAEKALESKEHLAEAELDLEEALGGRKLDIAERQMLLGEKGLTEASYWASREERGGMTEEEEFGAATDFLKEMFGAPTGAPTATELYTPTRDYLRETEVTLPTHPSEEYPGGWLAWLDETYPS